MSQYDWKCYSYKFYKKQGWPFIDWLANAGLIAALFVIFTIAVVACTQIYTTLNEQKIEAMR
jgi:hypothetical protein